MESHKGLPEQALANWPPEKKQKPNYPDFDDNEMVTAIARARHATIYKGLNDLGPVIGDGGPKLEPAINPELHVIDMTPSEVVEVTQVEKPAEPTELPVHQDTKLVAS